MYATKLEIDLCNFPAIWAVLFILLDTQSNKLQYVKNLQQVVNNYYDKCPTEVMSRLEHQITDIMNEMYDSVTNDNFDSVSDYTDRVSGAVDNDYDTNDTKDIQIKKSHKKGKEAKNAKRGNTDTLLDDAVANTTTGTEKGLKDKIGIDDIGIFEFIFHGLPELQELEGVDEDRLRELQNAIQEQLHQRDEERERNITKRVQEFEKTFDFANSNLLKGVATMAELTKTDNRQPMGKIKPTDKMVMMPSLFDGTKPATSKQHYERFNLYINFQTKSGHLTDPVKEAIDIFEHTLDKTALVWFQTNRSKFKDLTMLKNDVLTEIQPMGQDKKRTVTIMEHIII